MSEAVDSRIAYSPAQLSRWIGATRARIDQLHTRTRKLKSHCMDPHLNDDDDDDDEVSRQREQAALKAQLPAGPLKQNSRKRKRTAIEGPRTRTTNAIAALLGLSAED